MRSCDKEQGKQEEVQKNEMSPDILDKMLLAAYSTECVPERVNIRLKNQLASQKAIGENRISFWWLPATMSTVVLLAFSIILCLIYLVINIKGGGFCMPNFLQFISRVWLKMHLAMVVFEITISWIVTFIGLWKGNLIHNAKIL